MSEKFILFSKSLLLLIIVVNIILINVFYSGEVIFYKKLLSDLYISINVINIGVSLPLIFVNIFLKNKSILSKIFTVISGILIIAGFILSITYQFNFIKAIYNPKYLNHNALASILVLFIIAIIVEALIIVLTFFSIKRKEQK